MPARARAQLQLPRPIAGRRAARGPGCMVAALLSAGAMAAFFNRPFRAAFVGPPVGLDSAGTLSGSHILDAGLPHLTLADAAAAPPSPFEAADAAAGAADAAAGAAAAAEPFSLPSITLPYSVANWKPPPLPKLRTVQEREDFLTSTSEDTELGTTDSWFWLYLILLGIVVFATLNFVLEEFFRTRKIAEEVNNKKLLFISSEERTTPLDQLELGKLYSRIPDQMSALAEFEEVEENFEDLRIIIDPEDAMGALAARAVLHNAKGYSLTLLEPPRTAQARREFVRAVTYWPEYPEGLLNIGNELLKRKRWDVAIRTLLAAQKWMPASELISKALAQAQKGQQLAQEEKQAEEEEYDSDDEEELVELEPLGQSARR